MKNQITLFLVLSLSTVITPTVANNDFGQVNASPKVIANYLDKKQNEKKEVEIKTHENDWKNWAKKHEYAIIIFVSGVILTLVLTAVFSNGNNNDDNEAGGYDDVAGILRQGVRYTNIPNIHEDGTPAVRVFSPRFYE